jgi:hypothetical protein
VWTTLITGPIYTDFQLVDDYCALNCAPESKPPLLE